MYSYLSLALGLLATLTVYFAASAFYHNRRHARKARELGCQPPFVRPHRLPFGLDLLRQIIRADKEQVVPQYFLELYHALGKPTWVQNQIGTMFYITTDPKNIQALLATQFNDFEIGPMRRGNFFPLLGNGIFTSDGKSW